MDTHHQRKDLYGYKADTKMVFRIAQSIHDSDVMNGVLKGGYLARATKVLRELIGECLRADKGCKLYKLTTLVLTADGPKYFSKKKLASMHVRRVGDYYYTHDFATHLFRDSILTRGVFSKVRLAAIGRAIHAGSELTSLFPTRVDTWANLVGDVFESPEAQALKKFLKVECETHREFISMSIDGTNKACFTLLGQPSYLASKKEKAAHATPAADQKHTLITGLGLSGAPVVLQTALTEKAKEIGAVLACECTQSQLFDIEHVAVDNPSRKLFDELKGVGCVNLGNMSLCRPHLAFNYESVNWEKKTHGSRFLRLMLEKARSNRDPTPNVSTGTVYDGSDNTLTGREEAKVKRIRRQSMCLRDARKIESTLDPTVAFKSRSEYMDCLAALVVLYSDEVKKTHTSGRRVTDILASSCYPDRLEYMFNEARFVRKLPKVEQALFQSGVCGNEAFHRETKNTFNGQSLHLATLDMKLEHLQVRKLLAHNIALYHPTVHWMSEQEVVQRRVSSMDLWPTSWGEWCSGAGVLSRGRIPRLGFKRAVEAARLHTWKAKNQRSGQSSASQKVTKKVDIFRKPKSSHKLRR